MEAWNGGLVIRNSEKASSREDCPQTQTIREKWQRSEQEMKNKESLIVARSGLDS
jgi:hypothetical protein